MKRSGFKPKPKTWRQYRPAGEKAAPKYNNERKRGFPSVRQANDATDLYLLEKAGHIRELRHEVTFILYVNKKRVTTYRADFTYYRKDSERLVIHETKGMWTREFVIKWKLIQAIHPEHEYVIT